jgi:guanine nucleotide exchange factor
MLAAALPESLFFDLISAEEVDAVYELEAKGKPISMLSRVLCLIVVCLGFSPEEAATLEKLRYVDDATHFSHAHWHFTWWHIISFRQANAPELFLGAFVPQTGGRELLGYMDGVLSSEATLTSESMSTHIPGARTVLIHGVCVSDDVRRRGIATALIAEYQRRLAGGPYERALLIAHKDKAAFYERIGFKSRGLSAISFAGIPWVELEWAVPIDKSTGSQGVPQATSRGLLEALQSQSASPRRQGQLLSSFPSGILDLTEKGDTATNRYDMLCVNERCGSIILRRGVAVLQERECVEVSALSSIGWGKV